MTFTRFKRRLESILRQQGREHVAAALNGPEALEAFLRAAFVRACSGSVPARLNGIAVTVWPAPSHILTEENGWMPGWSSTRLFQAIRSGALRSAKGGKTKG